LKGDFQFLSAGIIPFWAGGGEAATYTQGGVAPCQNWSCLNRPLVAEWRMAFLRERLSVRGIGSPCVPGWICSRRERDTNAASRSDLNHQATKGTKKPASKTWCPRRPGGLNVRWDGTRTMGRDTTWTDGTKLSRGRRVPRKVMPDNQLRRAPDGRDTLAR